MAATTTLRSMAMAGVIPMPDQQLHLLPLLQNTTDSAPPLDQLPHGFPTPSRVAFSLTDRHGRSTDWISTTHVFPSAYPRSHYACTAPPSTPISEPDGSRANYDKAAEQAARKVDLQLWDDFTSVFAPESLYPPSSEEEARRLAVGLAESGQPQLWSCVQRIVPSRRVEDGVTLFLAHANGFHKEIYEPTVESLIRALEKQGNGAPAVGEVWSIDTFNSGDAAALNRGKLGQAVSWMDHPRDILQFLDFYMPVLGEEAPTALPVHAQGSTRSARRMIGVGHSFSGAGMIMLNSLYPDIFQGLFVIDPVGPPIDQVKEFPIPTDVPMARSAVARKDVFASRRVAGDYLGSKPFFQAWDPRVLALHLRFGFYPVPGHESKGDPPVTLSMSKWSEALAFSTSFLGSLSNAQIKRSRFSGWAHLICTTGGQASLYGDDGVKLLTKTFIESFSTSGRASAEVVDAGHLVAQEQPDSLGARLAQVMSDYVRASGSRSRL